MVLGGLSAPFFFMHYFEQSQIVLRRFKFVVVENALFGR